MLKLVLWGFTLLILAGTITIAGAYLFLIGAINADVSRLAEEAVPPARTITTQMVDALPPAARRYFHKAGVVGQPIPRIVRLKQRGHIRASAADNWMEFEAEETYSINPPTFIWRASFPTPLTPIVLGRDEYFDGRGTILMKMLALIPVADESGDELRAAGLMRYLNETMWFP